MKLSEAIRLGSTVLAPKAGRLHYSELNAGCALGMAAIANGCTFRPVTQPFSEKDRRTLGTEAVWGNWVLATVRRPCQCWRFWVPREMRIKDIIAHLFDYHVMARENWTLEQLVAWVETVEPTNNSSLRSEYEIRPSTIRRDWHPCAPPEVQFETGQSSRVSNARRIGLQQHAQARRSAWYAGRSSVSGGEATGWSPSGSMVPPESRDLLVAFEPRKGPTDKIGAVIVTRNQDGTYLVVHGAGQTLTATDLPSAIDATIACVRSDDAELVNLRA